MTEKNTAKITPLWVIATFVTLTEAVLGFAATQVSGGIQVALTSFVIGFALLVFTAFFVILWSRPWVFYPPSEYSNVDPKEFMTALSNTNPAIRKQAELIKTVEANPLDAEARFELLENMVDDPEQQILILMHETVKEIPQYMNYIYEFSDGTSGNGALGMLRKGIKSSGLVKECGSGRLLALTNEGSNFAQWLKSKDRKCDFLWTPVGGWGEPRKGYFAEKALSQHLNHDPVTDPPLASYSMNEPIPTAIKPT